VSGDFANRLDALVQALILSVTAPTDEKSGQAVELVNKLAHGMLELDIQRAKDIAQELLGAASSLEDARGALDEAMDEARQAAIKAIKAGATEVRVAEALGVNRHTVRRWLGK
jgi:hypothetical protein